MGLIWDLMQFEDIRRAQSAADKASLKAEGATNEVGTLEMRFERLALVTEAMWELLKANTNLGERDLLAKMRELDLSDGKLDGRKHRTVKKCSSCERVMNPRHQKCIYCGTERLAESAFDGV